MQFSGLCRLYSSVSLLASATALAAAFPRNEADNRHCQFYLRAGAAHIASWNDRGLAQ